MSAPRGDRGGFALALVVLMLFAIAVAGVTGYQVVSSEFTMAQQNRDGQEALSVARAGLQRFLGEQIGQIGDSVSYAIGDGVATVTARKVLEKDTLNHLYYIQSTGQVADARTPLLPATRTVGVYAWHRLNPIPLKGAMLLTGGRLYVYYGSVDGNDHASTADCPGGSTAGTAGVGIPGGSSRVTVLSFYGGSVDGNPTTESYANYQAVYDTVGIRWDILSDPSFPVDFENTWPNFGDLDPDSFPIIRYDGNLTAWGSAFSGRGVLIVTGRLTVLYDFVWDGIILAGRFYYASTSSSGTEPVVNGMLIGGMEESQSSNTSYILYGNINYHSCNVYDANRSLSYLEVVRNSMFEVNH